MMRARVGIDKTKSWADWVEEEDEAATQIVTPEDSKADAEPKGEPTLRLGMRLRGGDPAWRERATMEVSRRFEKDEMSISANISRDL
jgi:hypothetical protein